MKGLTFTFLLLVIVAFLFMGQSLREEKGSDYDIDAYLQNISWNYTYDTVNSSNLEVGVHKFVDAYGFAGINIGKGTIRYGFNNPKYDFDWMFNFVKMILIALICLAALPVLPYLIGLCYVLFLGLKKLFLSVISWVKRGA